MKIETLFLTAALASAMTLVGCKKKQAAPESGSAGSAGSDTGSSSATGSAAAGSAAAGSAAAGSAAAEAVEPAKTCSASAWKEKTGLFCVDAPPDFKPGEPKDWLDGDGFQVQFKREAAGDKPALSFVVQWHKVSDDPNAESIALAGSMESDYKNQKGEDQGKFAGGKGRYFVFARKPEEKSHRLNAVVNGKKHAYSCEAETYEMPMAPELVAGCKSVIPTD